MRWVVRGVRNGRNVDNCVGLETEHSGEDARGVAGEIETYVFVGRCGIGRVMHPSGQVGGANPVSSGLCGTHDVAADLAV